MKESTTLVTTNPTELALNDNSVPPTTPEAPVETKKKAKRKLSLKVRHSFKERFGISIAAALRHLGNKKVKTADAVFGLKTLGIRGVSIHTVKTQLFCGKSKSLSHGPLPKVSAEVSAQLIAACTRPVEPANEAQTSTVA